MGGTYSDPAMKMTPTGLFTFKNKVTLNATQGTAPIAVTSTTKVDNLNVDLLDGEHGSYYLDYNNLTNKPTISDAKITLSAGNGLTTGGDFTLNQSSAETITFNVGAGNGINVAADAVSVKAGNGITVDANGVHHSDTSNAANLTATSRTYVTGLTFDTYGHVTGYTTGTETVANTDTWREIKVNGTSILGTATTTGALNLKAGTAITISATAGSSDVTITSSDTKNTAGSTNSDSKLFLIGATSQAANPQTYSDSEVYTTNGTLTTNKVQVGNGTATMQYDSTNQCIRFVIG